MTDDDTFATVHPAGARLPFDILAAAIASMGDIDEAIKSLPQEAQDEYRRNQQSVIDARRSANRVEGQMWIG